MVEGIACAPVVTGRVLLDAAASLTWGITGECDDVKGTAHAGCVRGAGQAMAFLLSLEGGSSVAICTPARKSSPRSAPVLVHGARPARHQVHSSGPWDDPSHECSTIPVSSRGTRRRRSWWCHTPLIDSGYPNPCEAGGGIRCGLQARLDMGPHGVPRGSSLAGQTQDSGSLDAQLSDRPADRPRPQTRPGCAHRMVMLDECHRLAGTFTAHPAPYCATGSAQGPRPKARRSTSPPRANDREQVTPQPGQPAQRSQDFLSSTRAHSRRAAATRWKPSKSASRSHRPQRSGDAEQQVG